MITHTKLSSALRELHRELLRSVEREHAALHGRTTSPYALFRLASEDPLFAWLQPLTAALAELDDADDPDEPARLWRAIERIEGLLGGEDEGFSERYLPRLQSEPEVAVAHGTARTQLRALASPRPKPTVNG